jgi:hypothetical protein
MILRKYVMQPFYVCMAACLLGNMAASAATANFNDVFGTTCTTCTEEQASITTTTELGGSQYRFTSQIPGDLQFSGNNVNGVLTYYAPGNVLVTKYGIVSRLFKSAGAVIGFYFWETNNTYATGTGAAYFFVRNTQEANVANNTAYNTSSDPVDAQLNDALVLPFNSIQLQVNKSAFGAQLSWKVFSDKAAARYDIERSADGTVFEKLTSVGGITLQYNDATPQTKTMFYRVRMIDTQGKQIISNAVAIRHNVSRQPVQVYPNPAKGTLYYSIETAGLYQVVLADNRGRILRSETVQAGNGGLQSSIERKQLPAGVYMLRISGNNGAVVHTSKVVFE